MLLKVQREVDRCKRVMNERVRPHVHHVLAQCDVQAVRYTGEPVNPSTFLDEARHGGVAFTPLAVGEPWGTTWGTTWMKVTGQLPRNSGNGHPIELLFNLGWLDWPVGGHIEGMVYRPDGSVIKAIHPRNYWIPLVDDQGKADQVVDHDGAFTVYVEAAYNPNVPSFTVTSLGDAPTGKADERYVFESVQIAEYDHEVHEYWIDLDIVSGAVEQLDAGSPRYWKLAKALQRSMNIFDGADEETVRATLPAARETLEAVMNKPSAPSALQLSAMGHAHIDSAWLWPVRETKRKVGRTIANVLTLLDNDPKFCYVMSSAQQYAWLEERHPDLFKRVQRYVQEGRFIPVGGMWVESDGMVPSGESLIRQLSYGQRYFKQKFGVETHGVWLPDSFGYSGSWPQIARRSGARWFLTQKLCWNDTTRLPHHSFMWEGIDGSRIFTHFPPADKYDSDMSPKDLHYAEQNFKDKDLSDHGILLFGYGDGGGGPTREMTMRAARLRSFEGLPRVEYDNPDHFFDVAYHDMADQAGSEMPTWKGELYLELHRKTLTSQQDMKRGCRKEESWLRMAEYCCAYAELANEEYVYPREELDRIWKTLLLNQFHDILPGSGIAWIYRVARKEYAEDIARLRELTAEALRAVEASTKTRIWPEARIMQVGRAETGEASWSPVNAKGTVRNASAVAVSHNANSELILDNSLLRVVIAQSGVVTSICDLATGREIVASGQSCGLYQVLKDEPGVFDAWDVERDAFLAVSDLDQGQIEDVKTDEDGTVHVHVINKYRASTIRTSISLRPGLRQLDFHADVDWLVPEKLLKVALPLAVRADRAQYETQFGLIERPIVKNTEGDEARFESCTHRFVRIANEEFGVGIVNGSTYGSDVSAIYGPENGPEVGTQVRLTLVGAPKAPDPHADLGHHEFDWALVPGPDLDSTLAAAAEINAPVLKDVPDMEPLIGLQNVQGLPVVDWIKMADDGSGDLIVRIYEANGQPACASLALNGPMVGAQVYETDLLERDRHYQGEPDALKQPGAAEGARLDLGPFQIATLRLSKAGIQG